MISTNAWGIERLRTDEDEDVVELLPMSFEKEINAQVVAGTYKHAKVVPVIVTKKAGEAK